MVGPRLIHRFGVLLAALTFLLIGYPYFDDTRTGTFLGGIASLLVLAGAVYRCGKIAGHCGPDSSSCS